MARSRSLEGAPLIYVFIIFCIELFLRMKNGSILIISNEKNHDSNQPATLISRCNSIKVLLCIWWEYHKMLWYYELVNHPIVKLSEKAIFRVEYSIFSGYPNSEAMCSKKKAKKEKRSKRIISIGMITIEKRIVILQQYIRYYSIMSI